MDENIAMKKLEALEAETTRRRKWGACIYIYSHEYIEKKYKKSHSRKVKNSKTTAPKQMKELW